MKISYTTTPKSRDELDAYVRSQFGTQNKDKNLEIELTEEEAANFQLSESSTVFEAKVKVNKKATK